MANSFIFAIENIEAMKGNVYNVGTANNNYSKEEVALMIREKIDYYLHFADIGEDKDKRDYVVSYDKIEKLGYRAVITIEEGIDQLIKVIPVIDYRGHYRNV